MTLLCQTVQSLGKQMQDVQNLDRQMQDGFAAENRRRQEDYTKMEEAMTAKMEEGLRNEQQARQQAQNDVMAGLKNEENARQMVQTDLQAIKDKIRQLESGSGSGSTVGSEVSAAVGRVTKRYFRKSTAGSCRSAQRLVYAKKDGIQVTDTGVSNFINDLHQMVPEALKKSTCIGSRPKVKWFHPDSRR